MNHCNLQDLHISQNEESTCGSYEEGEESEVPHLTKKSEIKKNTPESSTCHLFKKVTSGTHPEDWSQSCEVGHPRNETPELLLAGLNVLWQ